MQYILTQEEKDALVPLERLERRDKVIEIAREMILKASKFTCIHKSKDKYDNYCNDCPLGMLKCHKDAADYLCRLSQSYSK